MLKEATEYSTKLLYAKTQWGKSGTQLEVAGRFLFDPLSDDDRQVVCISGVSDRIQKKEDFLKKVRKAFDTKNFEKQYYNMKKQIKSTTDSTKKENLNKKLKITKKKF